MQFALPANRLSIGLLKSSCFKPKAMTGSFHKAHCSIVIYPKRASKAEMLKQTGISTNEIH